MHHGITKHLCLPAYSGTFLKPTEKYRCFDEVPALKTNCEDHCNGATMIDATWAKLIY